MNEQGFSPQLALVSVCCVVFLVACPEAVFAMIGIVFSLVIVGGMVLAMALLFGFSCYCVYQILREIGRMLGG